MLTALFLTALVFFLICYKFYGGFLTRVFKLDDKSKTPAEEMYDEVDYRPPTPPSSSAIIFLPLPERGLSSAR